MEFNQESGSSNNKTSTPDLPKKWLVRSWSYLLCVFIGILASASIIYTLETGFAEMRHTNNSIATLDSEVKEVLVNTIRHSYAGYLRDDSGAPVSSNQIECNCQLSFNFMQYTIVLNGNFWTVTNNETGETVNGTVEQIYSEDDII